MKDYRRVSSTAESMAKTWTDETSQYHEKETPARQGDEPSTMDKGWSWMVAFGSFIVLFIVIAYIRNAGIFFVAIKAKTGASTEQVAWVSTSFMICNQLLTPLGCTLAVHFGTRPVVILGGFLMSAGLALSTLSTNLTMYIITLGVLEGVGAAFCLLPSVIILGFHFQKRIGLAYSLAFSGSCIGHMVLAPTLTILTDYYGLQGALLIMGGITLHIVIAGALFVAREVPSVNQSDSQAQLDVYQSRTSVHESKTQWSVFKRLIRTPTFYALCIYLCGSSFVFCSVFKYIPPSGRLLGIGEETIALVFTVGGGTDLAARLVSGIIMDSEFVKKYVKRYRITASFILLMGVNAFVLSWVDDLVVFCACTVVHATLSGFLYSTSSIAVLDVLGKEQFPMGHSIGTMTGIFLAPMDSMALGKLRDVTGNFTASFCLIGATGLVSSAALFSHQCLVNARCGPADKPDPLVSEPLRANGANHACDSRPFQFE